MCMTLRGRVVLETAPDGASMTYVYDANGRLESATDALGNTASVVYDGNGQRVAVTDPLGRERVWSLDAVGRLLSYSVAGDVQLTQVFDAAGRLTQRTFGDGSSTGYVYDSAGRLTGIDYPDRADAVITYSDAGRRESVTDHRGVTSYAYDSRGRLVTVVAPEGTVEYAYDNAGRVVSMTTAVGTTSYTRDELGRISQVTDPDGGIYAIVRDAAGRVTSMVFPNGVTEAYTYDAAGRPMTVTVTDAGGTVLASFEATRDTVGRITALNDSVAGVDVDRAFGYDAAGRLTQVVSDASGAPSTTDYTLDGLGNRVTTTLDGSASAATVSTLDQLTGLGGDAFTYDDAGRLTSATRTGSTSTYNWTSQGELAQVTTPGASVDYAYDLDGNVVSRTEGGDTVEFVYDTLTGLPRAVSASDGSWWLYVDGVPLAQHTSTGTTAYLHTDVRGDVRLATDAAGTVTDTWTYSVDGELVARTGTTHVTVGWRGETHDSATGLIWLRARWYDPATARFLSADPWHGDPSNPISLNRYVYGNADPVNMHDPTGQYATSTSEQANTMYVHSVLTGIQFGSALRALTVLRQVTAALAAILATSVTVVAVTELASDNDQGIDGPGPVPDIEIYEDESTDPERQPQTDGAGARDGGPAQCYGDGTSSPPPTSSGSDYRKTFLNAHPELEGKVVVHHAVEQQVLRRFPGLFSAAEIHALSNLRGIPIEVNSQVHLSEIRRSWNEFYRNNPCPTREDILAHADYVDRMFGGIFLPATGG